MRRGMLMSISCASRRVDVLLVARFDACHTRQARRAPLFAEALFYDAAYADVAVPSTAMPCRCRF